MYVITINDVVHAESGPEVPVSVFFFSLFFFPGSHSIIYLFFFNKLYHILRAMSNSKVLTVNFNSAVFSKPLLRDQ